MIQNTNLNTLQNGKLAFSVNEASEATSLSKSHLRNEIRAGRLAVRRIGRRVIVTVQALNDYIENFGKENDNN